MKKLFVLQSDEHCRISTLPETALLVNLYCRNGENAVAAVREFVRLKKQHRGKMSERALIDMNFKRGEIRASRAARNFAGKRKEKCHHRRRRGHCYSDRGSKQ